jgi:metal-sulfur cluster biosynthetic enzyme
VERRPGRRERGVTAADSGAGIEDAVRAALDDVVDPCSEVAGVPAGLLEMGLVRDLEIEAGEAGATVRVTIGVTEPTCLMGPALASGARERLSAVPGIAGIEVSLCDDEWMPSDMAPTYRARLAAHRAAKRAALGLGGDVAETPLGASILVRKGG